MEKNCFVIMPLSEPEGYAQGHFNRVYEYIIIPACRTSGFTAIRAEDTVPANGSAWELVKDVVDSDMVICDLSSGNQNVLYGFAIRQALNLPLIAIKDMKTQSEFGALQYDDSLRIDTVQKAIELLSESLRNNFTNKGDINSVLSKLGLGQGDARRTSGSGASAFRSAEKVSIQAETTTQPESHLPVISPLPDFVGDPISQQDIDKLKSGDSLFHMNYGRGEVKSIKIMAKDKLATVLFESGSKMLVLATSGYFRKIKS